MKDQVRAIEAPDFVVDEDKGTLLNTNKSGLEGYKTQRAAVKKMRVLYSRVEKLERDVAALMNKLER